MSKVLRARGDHVVLIFEHGSVVNTDTTFKMFKAPRAMVIEKVDYHNVTGLAENASNYVTVSLRKASTDMTVPYTTNSAGPNSPDAIPADTHLDLAMSATPANRKLAEGDVLSLFVDCTGTVTLPAGRVAVTARYV